MIGGTLDFDAVFEQVGVGFAQCRITGDLERDVREPKLSVPRPRRVLWRGMLRDVDCMEAIAQSHEHTAVLWILLGDTKPQHVAVEPL